MARLFNAVAGGLLGVVLSIAHVTPGPLEGPPRPRSGGNDGLPGVMLWAWERPENLAGVDARLAGVAFLAGTVRLRGDDVIVRPRLQPLRVPPGIGLAAVVRIEPDRSSPPSLSEGQRRAVVDAIVERANASRVRLVQVDFDATVSQRRFYADLLGQLRARLPATTALSITALASWCLGDPWLADLPIDEAVPMLFRMGVDDRRVRNHLDAGRDFRLQVCRRAVGVSTDEPVAVPAWPGRRRYVFHPRRWSSETIAAALRPMERPR